MNLQIAINEGGRILKENNIDSFQLDSEILMSKAIDKDRKYLILNIKEIIKKNQFDYFKKLIDQRSKGRPIAYIVGKKEFWKYEFNINSHVLIPRPDSELIIDQALKVTKNKSKLNILDIGVGSGCILLSILKDQKTFYGTGIDLSKKCIELSKINATKLKLQNRVKLLKTNVDNFKHAKYDLIVSNPPYINKLKLKYLDRNVINFEPRLALDGGLDGLSEIRKVILKSSELIKKNGIFILEIAFDQKDKVTKLLRNKGFYINKVLKDLANNDRCIISTKI